MTNEIASIYENAKQGHIQGIKLLVSIFVRVSVDRFSLRNATLGTILPSRGLKTPSLLFPSVPSDLQALAPVLPLLLCVPLINPFSLSLRLSVISAEPSERRVQFASSGSVRKG
jgi:hypothetical protein